MTNDFAEDAADSLAHHERPYLMLVALNQTETMRASHIDNLSQLEWMRRRFEDWYNHMKLKFE